MLGQMLTSLAVVAAAVLNLTAPAVASPSPVPGAHRFDLSQLTFTAPTIFGAGGQGKPSPAGCHIIQPVQLPHVSTFEVARNSRREMKGKAFSACNTPVAELTLSVTILDYGAHKPILKGRVVTSKNEKAISSQDTLVPCVNTDTTTYQIAVLGTSFENGQEYFEIAFSKPWPLPCGYA